MTIIRKHVIESHGALRLSSVSAASLETIHYGFPSFSYSLRFFISFSLHDPFVGFINGEIFRNIEQCFVVIHAYKSISLKKKKHVAL